MVAQCFTKYATAASINLSHGLPWYTVVMSGLTVLLTTTVIEITKTYRTIGPSFTASVEPLAQI